MGFFFFNKGFKKYILKLLYKISIKFSEHTFFQNKEDAKYFYLNYLVKKNNYSILPGSGIDLKYYKFKEFPKNKITKILYVGRLIREKGIVELLEAARFIKKNNIKCNLYILGNIDDDNESNIDFDTSKLSKVFEKTKIGEHELQMIEESDEPELVNAWVEKFWEIQKCPDCNTSLTPEAECLDCGKDYLA